MIIASDQRTVMQVCENGRPVQPWEGEMTLNRAVASVTLFFLGLSAAFAQQPATTASNDL
jgi:hypothetical protein